MHGGSGLRYDDPALRDKLASEYVLGTLHGRARKRFESLLRRDSALVESVRAWQRRLLPLAEALPALTPSIGALERIERQLGFARR
jgi:anti-sigma-K factor RskA